MEAQNASVDGAVAAAVDYGAGLISEAERGDPLDAAWTCLSRRGAGSTPPGAIARRPSFS